MTYVHLSDDEADVASDALGLVARDEDPEVARARMRWIARASGTPFARRIEACDWRSKDNNLLTFSETFLAVPRSERRLMVRLAALTARRLVVPFLTHEPLPSPSSPGMSIWVRRAGDAEGTEEELRVRRVNDATDIVVAMLEQAEAWLEGTGTMEECRALWFPPLLTAAIRGGAGFSRQPAIYAVLSCYEALGTVVKADPVKSAANGFCCAARAWLAGWSRELLQERRDFSLAEFEAGRELLFRSVLEAWWIEHPKTGNPSAVRSKAQVVKEASHVR